ncbi:MAG TPA: cation acetate symporter [Candidatus Hydrogenedentes bacterium]|nr:cation acetate symporter [Candidatus Hydrogenedentota bacterium]
MSTENWTFLFVFITFSTYLYIGWRSRVNESAGFYVAGQGVPAIANGAATAADWMSAASFISMAGLISTMGYDGTVYLMGWTGGYVLLALLLAPYLRKFGQYTVPDFVGTRYYSDVARIVAVICAVFVSITYVAGQMSGVGIVFSRFLGVDIRIGVIIGMFIVAFFALLGGMKGITWTQVAQYGVLITAFLIPSCAIAFKLTGIPIPQIALTTSTIVERLNQIQVDLGFTEFTQPFQGKTMTDVFCITVALMVGTAGLPHVIVRFYTVPNVRAARYSAVWALIFIALLYTTAPALAVFARYNLLTSLNGASISQEAAQNTEETDGKEVYTLSKISEEGDELNYAWTNSWQKTGLLTFEDKNGDGIVQFVKDEAQNEVVVHKDIVVLSTPEVAGLAPWVIALVAAGGLAAALSTAAGLLLVISSSLAHDIYFRMINPEATEAKRVFVGRLMVLAAVFVAGYFGVNPPGFVAQVVAFAFGLAASSFFPVILLGIFSTRVNREGAIAGMVTGLVFTSTYIIGVKFFGWSYWCFGISAEGIGAIGMLLNFAVTIAVSAVTPPPPQEVQDIVQSLRLPDHAGPAIVLDEGHE